LAISANYFTLIRTGGKEMLFVCPNCTEKSLEITHSIDLPPDSRSDEISLQLVACASCHFVGIAVYEESRRGSFDADLFEHIGYHVTPSAFTALKGLLEQCPAPHNYRCDCPAHRTLGRQNAAGRWVGLEAFQHRNPFPIAY